MRARPRTLWPALDEHAAQVLAEEAGAAGDQHGSRSFACSSLRRRRLRRLSERLRRLGHRRVPAVAEASGAGSRRGASRRTAALDVRDVTSR